MANQARKFLDNCDVVDVRNGVVYRCSKNEGHEVEFGNEEHETQAREYAEKAPNWKDLAEASKPLLEWMVANEPTVGRERAEAARRVLVRMYMAATPRPGVARTTS